VELGKSNIRREREEVKRVRCALLGKIASVATEDLSCNRLDTVLLLGISAYRLKRRVVDPGTRLVPGASSRTHPTKDSPSCERAMGPTVNTVPMSHAC
jgi:hypothetical protein